MNSEAVQSEHGTEGKYVRLPVPVGDPEAFSNDATAEILHLLSEHPGRSFSNRELQRLTGKGMGNVNSAVRALEGLGVVRVGRHGRANDVRIDSKRLHNPADPVTTVPQETFHPPVRELVSRITDQISADAGIVLFGSVARGNADRASDIDLFVVVEDGRMEAQRRAHTIESDVASERFDGDRYESHILVETRSSAPDHDRIATILAEGITLHETDALEAVKTAVFENGP